MKIKSIHLYSGDGRRRDLAFHDGLNVITGRSSTGKSSLPDIIEFCMGRSSFNVSEGVIRDRVAWYAVIFRFAGEEVLVAKPAPAPSALSGSVAMIRRGASLNAPSSDELRCNDNDEGVVALLTDLLGIPENVTDVPIDSSRDSYDANIKHTLFYLFQRQTLLTSKDQLFYRQNEDYQPRTIKDTLPILLGVSGKDKFALESKLRIAQRELRLNSKLLQQAREALDNSGERAIGLLSEALAVGVLISSDELSRRDVVATLRGALDWRPTPVPEDDGRRISAIERGLTELRQRRREAERQIDAAQQFSRRADGFKGEATEQKDRLSSIKALPFNKATGEWQWPFAEANLGMETPVAQALLTELSSLDRELSAVTGERPALDAYLADQERNVALIGEELRAREEELASAVAASEMIAQIGDRNNAAARVVGRISLFLENLVPDTEFERLKREQRRLNARIADLEQRLGAEDSDARLAATLSNISVHMSGYIRELNAEHSQFPARFDLHNLTVVIDRPGRPIYMNKSGGGANHLAYHLAALLSLHRFAQAYERPLPRFLLIDQPTQVYFPSESVYESASGTIADTEKDADLEAVRRLFEMLLRFTKTDAPGFQLIVTEHANLREDWFQDAMVEEPWAKPPALVPEDWPDLPLA